MTFKILEIFIYLWKKNPRTLGPMASMITITPPRMTTAVSLCTALYKLGTFITETILANIKYLQQHSGTDFKLEKRNISGKVQRLH
jgi:hypothetical protein